jgi:hydrophobe/amphiphile efflux-3 (HAE3) family protein
MKLENMVVKFRWPIMIACFLATAFMGWELSHMQMDTDMEAMLPDSMHSRIDTKKIEAQFGSADALMYIFEADDVLNQKTLDRIDKVTRAFKKIPGVKKVMSLSNAKDIKGENGSMIVANAVTRIPDVLAEKEALRQKLRDNEMVAEAVVSKDFKATAIIVSLKTNSNYQKTYDETQKVIQENPGVEKVSVGGKPAFQAQIAKDVPKDMAVLIPAALVIMLLVLYGFFRTTRSIMLPFLVVVFSTIFGMGLLPLLGWKVTMITAILPLMVVAYANNYGLYLMARYREMHVQHGHVDPVAIVHQVLKDLAAPIFFTGLITIAGILGLLSHVMIPARQVGVAASLAIGFSVLASLGGIPAVLSLMPLPKLSKEKNKHTWIWLDKTLAWTSGRIIGYTKPVLLGSLVIAVLGVSAASLLKVDANTEKMFAKNHPITQCTNLINKYFGGTQNISLMFEGDIKDPALLHSMEKYKAELLHFPGVGQVMSMADIVKILSRALNDKNEPGYDKIPETREAVAQYLELYSMSGDPDDFEQMVDFDYQKSQFIIRVTDGSTASVNRIMKKVRELTKNDPHVTLMGGYSTVISELAGTLIDGQVNSIAFALVIIMLLVMLLFRSFAAGLLSSVPLVLSMILGFGIMGIFGIRLDIATAIISSIVMGTGVDFTVQFLWKYRALREAGQEPAEAVTQTLAGTGKAIAFNAICVVSGLGVLVFSSMPPLRHFAILFCVLTLACMVGSLVVVPSLCMFWRPKFLEPKIAHAKARK